ncbi:DUF4242 domain-containing protein [Caenorhabditis elegans]|uniref:DUF4242 domain-containing protein n=1 Tax=Caenorhabditis elegans TaxID=6239 RepID=Q9N485_CAEEL|nr:DUF4242 domain-containing protein [Caenorhabditis elegans]CCD72230.1 DUF4242 domain-containing protein [Caenorhabditis elegans]|eukprot:NP_500657.1 Uncharacterized protein CELE_Y17G9A.3 [Caenorhabditis elegans]
MQKNRPLKDFTSSNQGLVLILVGLWLFALSSFGLTFFSLQRIASVESSKLPLKLKYIWPKNVKKIVDYVIENDMHVTNDDRAVLIKTELMRFDTTDVFYIMVYDNKGETESNSFYGNAEQYITSYNPGKCNIVIYRSHYWRSTSKRAKNNIENEVKIICAEELKKQPDGLENLIKNIEDARFIGLIEKNRAVSIRSANSFGRARGPGWWNKCLEVYPDTKKLTGKQFILIVGFK